MTRIAILQCEKLPDFITWEIPNLEDLFEEDDLLIQGFEALGFQASPVIWTDPGIDWNKFDLALIRSTWDYIDDPELFIKVLSKIEASSCRLFNPLAAISWNMNKRYLLDLEKSGVLIVPTYLVSDFDLNTLLKMFIKNEWHDVILKPTIGLGGSHTFRVSLNELDSTLNMLKRNHPQREYIIQPFIDNIITEGELSFIYFNKELSHVLLKEPAPNDYRVQEIYGGTIQTTTPQPNDLRQAEDVISKLPYDVLYARLDFVRTDKELSVMEIELIEPVFSFNLVPESIMRLVHAAVTRLEKIK